MTALWLLLLVSPAWAQEEGASDEAPELPFERDESDARPDPLAESPEEAAARAAAAEQADRLAIETLASLPADAVQLDLGAAMSTAVEANLGLRAKIRELEAAQGRVQAAWGPFMPFVFAGVSVSPGRSKDFQFFGSTVVANFGNNTAFNYNVGAGVNVFTGTNLQVRWSQFGFNSVQQTDSDQDLLDGDVTFQRRNADFTIELNQNLLEGISPNYQLRALHQAQLAEETADLDRQAQVATVVGDVFKAWLDLVAARRNVEISAISLRNASEQRDVTKARIAAGSLAPIELMRVEETVASRSADLLEAERAAEEANQSLRVLMGESAAAASFGQAIRPLGGIPRGVLPGRDREASMSVATERNVDLARQRRGVEGQLISEKAARHELLPSLDLNASYTSTGTGLGFDDAAAAQQEALTDIAQARLPGATVGVEFNMPLPDLGSIHNLRAAKADREAAELALDAAEQQVLAGVATAFRSIESFDKQVEVARVRTALASQNAEAAEATYQAGRNTLRDVLEAQQSLEEARQAEVAAEVQALKARVDLEVLRGTLLDALSIELP
jgi:outer membrane protein TolC